MKPAPNPKDTQDFQFKQASFNRQVYDSFKNVPTVCSLIVTDAKRGLLYLSYENKLTILKAEPEPMSDWRLDHNLPYTISRLSISCDYSYLAVTYLHLSTAHIFHISSLLKNGPLQPVQSVELSTHSQNVCAYDLRWNPKIPVMFCTVASDHSVGTFQLKPDQNNALAVIALEKMQEFEANCIAWSPKGKQLVIGCKNGNIIQLKPELKVARTINGPSPSIGSIISILWISNYQFCAAYMDEINERRINVLIVDAPKGETNPMFTCYEDITYGMPDADSKYLPRYYFDHIPEWNLIIAASSSSSEIAVLGSLDNGNNWEQWQLVDNGRAQLPFVHTAESYPVGTTIDQSSTIILPWGPEGNTLPHPVPILHLFGTSGQIVSFHMINLLPNAASLCSPPSEPLMLLPRQCYPAMKLPQSEMSFSLNNAATSTPRMKQDSPLIERPKVVIPTPNIFSEPPKPLANVASSLATALQPQNPPQLQALEANSQPKAPIEQPEVRSVIVTKPEVVIPPVKDVPAPVPTAPVSASPPPASVPVAAAPVVEKINYDDAIFWRNFCEEIGHFERELQGKLKEPQAWEIGNDDDRKKLIIQSAQMEEFKLELIKATDGLKNEVIYLKVLMLETFAWLEETKSRIATSTSDVSTSDRSKIQELQRKYTQTDTQLFQAMKATDMHWAEHESEFSERTKMKIPSMEFVYQNLKKQAQIIVKQKETIEHLSRKWRNLGRGNRVANLNRSMAKMQINNHGTSGSSGINSDSGGGGGAGVGGVSGGGGVIEIRCRTIADSVRNFSRDKQIRLREILLQTEPKIIKAITPSPVQHKLEATLSSLASQSCQTPTSAIVAAAKQRDKIAADQLLATESSIQSSTQVTSSVNLVPPLATGTTTSASDISTSAAPVPKITATPAANPLASLNNIVAKLGVGAEPSAAQPKVQQLSFPAPMQSAFPSTLLFNNSISITKAAEKPPIVETNQPVKPDFSVSALMSTQIPVSVTTFSNSPSFGSVEPKSDTLATMLAATDLSKPSQALAFKPQLTVPLKPSAPMPFQASSLDGTLPVRVAKAEPQPPQNLSTMGLNFNLSLGDAILPVVTSTSNQQNVFSFANNAPFTLLISKSVTAPTPTPLATAGNLSTSFLPVKANESAVLLPVSTESTPAALDFSKLSTNFSSSNLVNKPPATTASTLLSTLTATTVPASSAPVTTINFGKATSALSAVPQSAKISSSIALPSGTTIEKVPPAAAVSAATTTATASTPRAFGIPSTGGNIFGGTTVTTSPGFGASLFGAMAPAISTSSTDKPTTVPSFFGMSLSSTSSFPSKPVAASTSSLNTPASQMINFGKSSTTSATTAPSTIFSKPTSTSAAMGGISIPPIETIIAQRFGQSAINQTASPIKSPTTAPAISGFFSSPPAAASPFGVASAVQSPTQPQNIFSGGGPPVSPESTPIFGGAPVATPTSPFGAPTGGSMFGGSPKPAGAPVFGGAATFASPTMSPQATGGFGSPSAFGAKPIFGAQSPPMFGAAKPEFGTGFGSGATFGSFGATASPLGSAPMDKVFGGAAGVNTFESLAGQNNGLTFGGLAQKNPTADKPAFSGGNSFTAWR